MYVITFKTVLDFPTSAGIVIIIITRKTVWMGFFFFIEYWRWAVKLLKKKTVVGPCLVCCFGRGASNTVTTTVPVNDRIFYCKRFVRLCETRQNRGFKRNISVGHKIVFNLPNIFSKTTSSVPGFYIEKHPKLIVLYLRFFLLDSKPYYLHFITNKNNSKELGCTDIWIENVKNVPGHVRKSEIVREYL